VRLDRRDPSIRDRDVEVFAPLSGSVALRTIRSNVIAVSARFINQGAGKA